MTGRAAQRFIALYPARWRARYGKEFAHVLTAQPLTLRLAADVAGGAVDAWLRRAAWTEREEGDRMTANLMKRCAMGGPRMSTAEAWRAGWSMIGAALVLAGAQMAAAAIFGRNAYVEAFATMSFPALMVVMTAAVYMRGASLRARAAIVAGGLTLLSAIAVLSVLI